MPANITTQLQGLASILPSILRAGTEPKSPYSHREGHSVLKKFRTSKGQRKELQLSFLKVRKGWGLSLLWPFTVTLSLSRVGALERSGRMGLELLLLLWQDHFLRC